jgi:hypothetical protein
VRGIGTRSLAGVALLAGAALVMLHMGLFRPDYWAQLSPWAPFAAAAFAVLAGALVFRFWGLGEKGEYYLRVGWRLPLGAETALGPQQGVTLLVGRAPQVRVLDFPPPVQRVIFTGVFLAVGLVSLDNRGISLLASASARADRRSAEFCPEPEAAAEESAPRPGCRLVERAYQLGYVKSLGSCAPRPAAVVERRELCRRRQLDEPYLHYAWRLLDQALGKVASAYDGPGAADRIEEQIDHLDAKVPTMLDSISMQPRSSHHLFTNLPDPRPALGDRIGAAIDGPCGSRLAHLPHFPAIEEGPLGPSMLLEHVLAQLLFNPLYRPVVARCEEITVHWGAPDDACARLTADPARFLDEQGALPAVTGMLERRERRLELARLETRPAPVAEARRVVSFQCLMVGRGQTPAPVERLARLDGEPLPVREARVAPLARDGASQIRLYKIVAELMAEGFGYGRLTSNQTVGAAPEGEALAASFRDTALLLSKLDLLRDADLFVGNRWLVERADLLDVYPHHLHLKNFVETFRRQYAQHRGRL